VEIKEETCENKINYFKIPKNIFDKNNYLSTKTEIDSIVNKSASKSASSSKPRGIKIITDKKINFKTKEEEYIGN